MRGYFHTDSARDMEWLENVLRTAREQGRSIRLHTDDGRIMVKSGGGQWTAPISGTPDMFRDEPLLWESVPTGSLGEAQHESHDLSRYEQ